jgi:hypothetical protein
LQSHHASGKACGLSWPHVTKEVAHNPRATRPRATSSPSVHVPARNANANPFASDAERCRALPRWAIPFHVLPLLYEQERWAEAGELIGEPLVALEEVLDHARMHGPDHDKNGGAYVRHLVLEGQGTTARRVHRRLLGLYRGVAAIHRSLRAAGREAEAAAVREAALQFEDSPALRAALAAR